MSLLNKICVNSSAIRMHGGGIIDDGILYRYTRRFDNFDSSVRVQAFFSLDADGLRDRRLIYTKPVTAGAFIITVLRHITYHILLYFAILLLAHLLLVL